MCVMVYPVARPVPSFLSVCLVFYYPLALAQWAAATLDPPQGSLFFFFLFSFSFFFFPYKCLSTFVDQRLGTLCVSFILLK